MPPAVIVTPSAPPLNAAQQASAASRLRRQALYEEVARLRGIGAAITRIAAGLGADRKTAHGWLRLGRAPSWKQLSGDSILDPFKPFLGRRWSEGCRDPTQPWRELLAAASVKDCTVL